MTECRHVIVTGGGMEISCAPDECPHCLTKRIAELEADCECLRDSDNANARDLAIANATIIELKAENAALKAENAQHDWWGGGGR